jgi:hypothetical protein
MEINILCIPIDEQLQDHDVAKRTTGLKAFIGLKRPQAGFFK